MFQQLMKQVMQLAIDTEECLKGVIDLIFEKAISEPNFSVTYANMCRCLMGLKVPTTEKPTVTVNFRKLLLNRCQNDRSFSKKVEEQSRERPSQPEGLGKAASFWEEGDRGQDAGKRDATLPPVSLPKAALSEEELEKKSKAVQCVQELASPSPLFFFVRHGVESTLERSAIALEHMGRLLHQLLCAEHLSTAQYSQGLFEP
ncbi:Eukaryotic translation initiation factor 4 gamma 1 [Myotis davidii]|uniref:Eukaryotic translation initiation factor 4 gamma 1 n=1 Tax=Myotis davidii TaxID=225400 RepID=L5LFW2_MYODS|nr:Eukaryotic translation initiation factor 4 gamma 1 [Myotis davidii]